MAYYNCWTSVKSHGLQYQWTIILTTTHATSQDLAQEYYWNVFSKHGVPCNIVSNCGSKFTFPFWKALNATLGITQKQATAYHPQTDGQPECVNQVLEQYLWIFSNYNQDNWAEQLPMAKFVYNSTLHSSTTMTPIFANCGYKPRAMIAEENAIGTPFEADAKRLALIHKHCKEESTKAIATSQQYADRKQLPAPMFEIRSKMWLSTANLKLRRPTRKFSERRIGPYRIIAKTTKGLCKLELPNNLSRLHPVFDVLQLEPYVDNALASRQQPPLLPVEIEDKIEWEVKNVVDSRIQAGKFKYLIEWKGYNGDDKYLWGTKDNLDNAGNLVKAFHLHYPIKPWPGSIIKTKAPPIVPSTREANSKARRSPRTGTERLAKVVDAIACGAGRAGQERHTRNNRLKRAGLDKPPHL